MLRVLAALVRNPLEAVPAETFTHPLVITKVAGRTRVYVADPVLIHEALVNKANALVKSDEMLRALGPALGEGLLTADGEHWKWQRRSVAGAFRHDRLVEFQPAMIAAAERTRDRWLHRGDAPLDVGHEMMRTTFDIIVETMMSGGHGIHVDRVEQSITDYLTPSGWTFALALAAAPQWVPYPGRRRANSAVSFMRSSLAAVVAKRRAGGSARQDMISMLLAARDPESDRAMSDDEIIDNLMTFITAGHETTALGLAWTFHLLAQNPHHEEKVLEEIAAVTGGAPVRAEHVGELAYTKQVFSEAMRLYPPAPIIARTASREFDLGGYMVPKGATLYVPIYAVHRHASVWTDPERFDPDRFSPEAAKDRHRYAYLPFGAGPRVCIGNVFASMEAVAILAVLLQTFRLTSRDAAAPQPVMKVTLRPNRPLLMDASVRRPAPDRPATPNGS